MDRLSASRKYHNDELRRYCARVHISFLGENARPLIKTLRAGEGFLAQSSRWVHFGLQDHDEIKSVTVDWPGGASETFVDCEVNQRYELRQGVGRPTKAVVKTAASNLIPSTQGIEPVHSAARVLLTTLTPMIDVDFQDLVSGAHRTIALREDDQSTLVVLWASWCPTCLVELEELGRRVQELRSANIRVVALCVDRIAENELAEASKAVDLVSRLHLPFDSGWASPQLIDQLQLIHDSFILMSHPLPVPSSFLVDPLGQLSVIYKGPTKIEWLLEDVRHFQRSIVERFQASGQLAGSVIEHPSMLQALESSELIVRLRLARAFMDTGYLNVAARHFREACQFAPESSQARFGLGDVSLRQDRVTEAVDHLEKAIGLNSTHAESHFRLALALEKQRRYAEAVSHYREGLGIMPSFIEGANNLAWILATNPSSELRNGQEAVIWAEKCVRATEYKDAGMLDSLAASYAEVGQFEKAIELQAKVIQLVAPTAQRRYVERYQLYQAGKPFRVAE